MKRKFTVVEFNIQRCGYGRRRGGDASVEEALGHVMRGFRRWVDAAPHITHTLIEDVGDLYVKEVAENAGVYCVVLWKRDATEGEALGLRSDVPPGSDGAVEHHHFGDNFIPGYPLYFVVDPGRRRLLTIRPQFALRAGREELEKAVRFYMKAHSRELRPDPSTEGGVTVVRLRMVDDDGNSLEPSFGAALMKKKSAQDEIISQSASIRKLVHEIPLENRESSERSKILKPFIRLFSERLSRRGFSRTKTVRYEMDVAIDEESARQVFELQATARPKERIGFVMKGNAAVRWADQYVLRYERDIEVSRGDFVFRASELLAPFSR